MEESNAGKSADASAGGAVIVKQTCGRPTLHHREKIVVRAMAGAGRKKKSNAMMT